MIVYIFGIFFAGFVLMIWLCNAFRRSRQTPVDKVLDQKIELEQIVARHNANKIKQTDSQSDQK